MATVYVDTSAWIKLVVDEVESDAVAAWVAASSHTLVASLLVLTELHCAARRRSDVYDAQAVEAALDQLVLVDLTPADLRRAASAEHRLRAADAIHLAAATRLGSDAMLVYDAELAGAAVAVGLTVIAPHRGWSPDDVPREVTAGGV